jgi:hypothetical protein
MPVNPDEARPSSEEESETPNEMPGTPEEARPDSGIEDKPSNDKVEPAGKRRTEAREQ